jgi:hypothetical protein
VLPVPHPLLLVRLLKLFRSTFIVLGVPWNLPRASSPLGLALGSAMPVLAPTFWGTSSAICSLISSSLLAIRLSFFAEIGFAGRKSRRSVATELAAVAAFEVDALALVPAPSAGAKP